MTTIRRPSGLTINVPDSFNVADTSGLQRTRSRRRRSAPFRGGAPETDTAQAAELDALIEVLEEHDMQVFDDFEIEAGPPPRRLRGARTEPQAASLDVPLGAGENALILVEQDGVYSWHFADKTKSAGARRLRGGSPPGKVATFNLEVKEEPRPPTVRSARRGVVADYVVGKVTGVVLKFIAGRAIEGVVSFLERNVKKGPVLINSAADVAKWQRIDSLSGIPMRRRGAPRILLVVHGTFSSTEGSFGALTAYPWGQSFLEGALANYDVVVGFDHPTLSVTPYENAVDIFNMLRGAGWSAPPSIDAIAYSRGGLVLRSLIEELLPTGGWPGRIDRAVFVGCTNAGTRLADPQNWHAMVDLYTNLAMAGARALGMVPQFAAAARIAKQTLQGVATVLKYMATETVENRAIPGLAAMDPDGSFVAAINGRQPGQPTAAASNYYAITSEFEPGPGGPPEFTKRLKQTLANRFMDRMMGGPNDLVVDTASMTAIDLEYGNFIKGVHAYGRNPNVYHTVYFAQPDTARKLTDWLRLIDPALIATARAEGVPRAAVDMARTAMDVADAGTEVGATAAGDVDTDVRVLSAAMSATDAARAIRDEPSRYVIVRREHYGELYDYAFDADEVVERTMRRGRSVDLAEALNLHETDRSPRVNTAGEQEDAGGDSSRPTVVVDGNRRVGVLDAREEGGSDAAELASLARASRRGGAVNEVRRAAAMPRFEVPDREGIEVMAGYYEAGASSEGSDAATEPRRMRGAARPPRRGVVERGGPRRGRAAAGAGGAPRTSVSRGDDTPPPGPTSAPCDFHAEMPAEAEVGKVTSVEVTVSRETIERILSAVSVRATASVKSGEKIIVQAIGKKHCEVINDSRVEIDPPAPGDPKLMFFDIKPVHADDGEVWIVARQGQVPLVTLKLKPEFVKKSTGDTRRTTVDAVVAEAKPLSAPLHQLRINERLLGTELRLWFEIYSPELKILDSFTSEPLRVDREVYVNNLYTQLEKFWANDHDDYERFMANLRALGVGMLADLVPEKLQQILWDHQDELHSIQVISEEPFLPWELLHLKEPGKKLPLDGNKFLGEMGVVRWLHGSFPYDELDLSGERLYVVPDYPVADYKLPGAQAEKKALERVIQAKEFKPQESRAVHRLLNEPGKFDVLHFACHGLADTGSIWNAGLMMTGRTQQYGYETDMLTAEAVEAYGDLRRAGRSGPLVFVNACQAGRAGNTLTGIGGFAKAFVGTGADAFVGTLWSIGDLSALTFSEVFYEKLMAGKTISESTIAARQAAKSARDVTWLAYVVYGHPHARVK